MPIDQGPTPTDKTQTTNELRRAISFHSITVQQIALNPIPSHYTIFHGVTWHGITLHCITLSSRDCSMLYAGLNTLQCMSIGDLLLQFKPKHMHHLRHIHFHTCIHACIRVQHCICVHACARVHVQWRSRLRLVYVHARVHVCVHVNVYIHVCAYIWFAFTLRLRSRLQFFNLTNNHPIKSP